VYALAVGLSILLMVVVDMEHPPAAGTALGIAITGISWEVAIALISSVLILSLAHRLLANHLKDLI
jgi:CBS-domain-containing membrane protein